MLDQCKIKKEDFKKFIRDKAEADILDKNKEKVRMTIRSKAAKALEVISGKTYYNLIKSYRETLKRCILNFEANLREKSTILKLMGRKVILPYFLNFSDREAAILVLGVISGFKHNF